MRGEPRRAVVSPVTISAAALSRLPCGSVHCCTCFIGSYFVLTQAWVAEVEKWWPCPLNRGGDGEAGRLMCERRQSWRWAGSLGLAPVCPHLGRSACWLSPPVASHPCVHVDTLGRRHASCPFSLQPRLRCGAWEYLGNPSRCSDNARSLTRCATGELLQYSVITSKLLAVH